MKNTKLIVIIAILVLIPLSWYKMYSDSAEKEKEYNIYLTEARKKSEMGLVSAADSYYEAANKLYTSYDILIEQLQMYLDNEQPGSFAKKTEEVIKKYPKKIKAYEMLAEYYKSTGQYKEIYVLNDRVSKYKLSSKVIDELCREFENEYTYATACSYYSVGEFYNGYAIVQNKEGMYGYVNGIGELSLSCQYLDANPFNSDGLAGVTDFKGKSYIISNSGEKKYVDPEKRDIKELGYICYGRFSVKLDDKYYISDLNFNFSEKSYEFIATHDGKLAAAYDSGEWFFVNEKGERVSNKVYEYIKLDEKGIAFVNDRAFVKVDGKYIMIDSNENQIGKESFEDVYPFFGQAEASVKINNLWGYVDVNGTITIEPQYLDARPFAYGYAAVNKDGVWMYINSENEPTITGEFTDAKEVSGYMTAFTYIDGRWKLLKLIKYNH
ncbi:MAG: WG repeat-containing protein [Lachnospiraceae bacterium]|nr:WG repeat-containing protein [Lachnospiraceae bacterium]